MIHDTEITKFKNFLKNSLPRKLKEHQLKAAIHLLRVKNGANFSVPGAGKSTVVLAVYAWLKKLGKIDSLFVVGPPSCFGPWRIEFEATLGHSPTYETLVGGNPEERALKYYHSSKDIAELYLTSFQTLQRDIERAKFLLNRAQMKFFLVIDEAHYIKQPGGIWANSVLDVAPCATRRCVLTGTPFPHSYIDAINIFDAIYPSASPLNSLDKARLNNLVHAGKLMDAKSLLDQKIAPLFYRVRKSELHLAKPIFNKPTKVKMNPVERELYDTILDKIRNQSDLEFIRDLPTAQQLQKGRIMRLRQAVSNAKLLNSAIDGYKENLFDQYASLAGKIANYSSLETPGKISVLVESVEKLRASGEKVVIWSNFIGSLETIKNECLARDWDAEIICGNTPTETRYTNDILTRERIIERFKMADSGLDILVANPAACAESISLHKTCSHAIYYDLSYNCAQYLQSLDRIHRVGGSENKVSHYHFLQYEDTFEDDILKNLEKKCENMSLIIDSDFPIYDLDMSEDNADIDAYERIFNQ